MNMTRTAGAGIVVYGLGSFLAVTFSGSPGGDYTDGMVSSYVAGSHWLIAFALALLGSLSGLALVAFGEGLRHGDPAGRYVAALACGAAAVSVVGWFVLGGIDVAMAEGRSPVQQGVSHPVVYLVSEIGVLLAMCAPALLVGAAALVMGARLAMPSWLRGATWCAGVCGILTPLFFTYFAFILWTLVFGVWAMRSSGRVSEAARIATHV
jgi:hypothetical protein